MSENKPIDKDNQTVVSKVFVGNVPFKCTKEEFVECFKDADGFKSAEVIRNAGNFTTRGFGFVEMETKNTLNKLLEKNIRLKDRPLRLREYNPETPLPKQPFIKPITFKLFVRGVSNNGTVEKLTKKFSQYCNVMTCYVNKVKATGEPTGSAVVELDDKLAFQKILQDKVVTLEDGSTVSVYPFRKTNKKQKVGYRFEDLNSAYRAGFDAGKIVGFEEGKKHGSSSTAQDTVSILESIKNSK